MAITVTTLVTREPGAAGVPFCLAADSGDATGNETILADATNKSHWVEAIHVDYPAGTNKWFRINNDTTAVIGPIDLIATGNTSWYHKFLRPVEFTGAINIDAEAATSIHVIIEGYTDSNI